MPVNDVDITTGVTFFHPQLPTLYVQYAPTEVDWTYNLVTSETNTYAGQVVQVLGVNFDRFVISGRFGKEGQQDYDTLPKDGLSQYRQRRDPPTMSNSTGLTQMWTWFRNYMSIASQGVRAHNSTGAAAFDNYDQQPITITYQGTYDSPVDDNKVETSWRVYPINFPSFKIANDNFAPEWRVECQVYEAPRPLTGQIMQEAIARLAYEPLYQPGSKFSDPQPHDPRSSAADISKAALAAFEATLAAADFFMINLPDFPPAQLEQMIIQGYSIPNVGQVPKHTQMEDGADNPFSRGGILPDFWSQSELH